MSQWYADDIDTIIKDTGSSPAGLTTAEAEKRLQENGPNEIVSAKKKPVWLMFLNQFKDVMIVILVIAAVISGLVGDVTDTLVIIAIVILNAIVGFVQEYRAEKAMEALSKMAQTNATVLRDNGVSSIASSALVTGDIILLEAGNIIPADIRLIEAVQLKVNESSLTGESIAADKQINSLKETDLSPGDQTNIGFKGTHISNGRGKGIVIATAMNTELGKIASMLQEPGIQTPLQKRLGVFGRNLAYIVLVICLIVFISGYLRGENIVLMLLTSLSLAVAAIPEALPAVITIALSIGAKRMAKKNALIRKLPAVETLGSVNYICTDKTGTLTLNKMTVEQIVGTDFVIHQKDETDIDLFDDNYKYLMQAAALNNDVRNGGSVKISGDPTEIALYEFASSKEFSKADLERSFPRVAEIPFDSDRKCMSTIHQYGHKYMVFTKGAMEIMMDKTKDHPGLDKWQELMNQMLADGFRVLGFASRELDELPADINPGTIETNLDLSGMIAIIDPPRQEVAQAVAECKTAGIKPVMITGDHPTTAVSIAKRLEIINGDGDRMVTGSEMKKMSEQELEDAVHNITVYARVSPEQKMNIVKALQKKGAYVAMTGDGVNDAPALKRANIGVAMGITGTDVSKEAADMILLDDNFTTIVNAVKEGRRIYDNIRKFIRYVLTGNSAEIWTIFLAPFFNLPVPLLPIHILWINLVTDGLPGLALATEPEEKGIMKRPPLVQGQSIFSGGMGIHILWVGLLLAALTIGTQAYSIHIKDAHWQTMVFTVLCLGQLMHVMAIRSEHDSLFQQGLFSNKLLLYSIGFIFILQLVIIYVPFCNEIFKTQPLTLMELLTCIGLSAIVFVAVEIEKFFRRRP